MRAEHSQGFTKGGNVGSFFFLSLGRLVALVDLDGKGQEDEEQSQDQVQKVVILGEDLGDQHHTTLGIRRARDQQRRVAREGHRDDGQVVGILDRHQHLE